MTTLNTSANIISDVLFRAGEPVDGTSDFYTRTIEYLNRAYREIWMGGQAFNPEVNEPWLWLKKDPPGVLTILPTINTGSVSVTNNSVNATLSVAPTTSMTGRFFKVQGTADVFRVLAHTPGATAMVLDSVFTGPTQTLATYDLMALEYTLASDLLRVIAPMRIYGMNHIEVDGVDLVSLERDYPLALIQAGVPEKFAMVTETKIRFNKYGGLSASELYRVEYDYLQAPSAELGDDSGVPLVPIHHRSVLADMTLFYLFSAKADLRADGTGAMAKAGLKAMAMDNQARRAQMSRTMGQIITRPTKVQRFDRVLRTASGFIIG